MSKNNRQPQSYLEKIKFDPKLWAAPFAKYLTNIRLVILLTVTIAVLGLYGYYNLPKRLNPEIKIPIVNVLTILPGAAPEDVESLITIPLENEIRGIKGIDQITSVSRDGLSIITVQFFSNIDQERAKNEVQSKVDLVNNLPSDATTPSVKALDFEDQPIWVFAITSNKALPALMNFSRQLKNKLELLPKIDRVTLTGFDNQEISITIRPEKIIQYGVNPFLINQAIQKGLVSYPAGIVETDLNNFSTAIDSQINNIDDIRNLRLTIQGEMVKLEDIAVVAEQSKKNQAAAYIADTNSTAKRAVTFYVYKTNDSNISDAGDQAKTAVDQELKRFNNQFNLFTINNTPQRINDQFNDLLREFRSTIFLIVLCLLIFLGLRQALISTLTVPLTFLSAFFIMTFFNQSINFLTLFAFLIALGLLIDDTIVVVSAMTTYYQTKKFSPAETGLLVWRDTIIPIWSTTLTTLWSFLPLLISTGIIGEFIKPIPIVITAVMISSTAIAVLITLPLMIVLLKLKIARRVIILIQIIGVVIGIIVLGFFTLGHPLFFIITLIYLLLIFLFIRIKSLLFLKLKKTFNQQPLLKKIYTFILNISNKGLIDLEPVARLYYRLIMRVLNSKKAKQQVIFAIISYSIIAFLLFPLGFVQNEFFPKVDSDLIYVNLEMPPGTKITVTDKEALNILNQIRKTENVSFVSLEVGQKFTSNFNRSENSYSALFTVHLLKQNLRKKKSYEIAQLIRSRFTNYQTGTISVIEQGAGPPAGADLQIKILGDDFGVINLYVNKIVSYLKNQPGVTNVDMSVKQGTSRLLFVPDKNKLEINAVTVDTIGFWLRAYLSGFTFRSVNFDSQSLDKKDIALNLSPRTIDPAELTNLSITNALGQSIPLVNLGNFIPTYNPTIINREEGKRVISVTASVLPGYSTGSLNQKLEQYAGSLNLPEGYLWKTGGINEENRKSIISILQAMIIAFVLILITMVIQFQSYRQAIIVLMVIPLAVSSVFIIFALTGTPLSFPALIGVLSLFGIVVTNSMFIVDKINMNLREKMPFKQAIADAGASRLEPILLTKLNTILGLIPITIADPLWRGLGGAIISGLTLSSFIMLLFIPSVYYLWFKPPSDI